MKKIFLLILVFTISFSSCDSFKMDLREDEDVLNLEQADPAEFFSGIQLGFVSFFEAVNTPTMDVTRLTQMGSSSTYSTAFSPDDMNEIWSFAYAGFLMDAHSLKKLLDEKYDYPNMYAATEVLEAYVLLTLVDLFGDVPYSEAFQGGGNLNPQTDSAESLYDTAKMLLEDAKSKFDSNSIPLSGDLFFDNLISKWQRLANTMLLKIAINTRLVNDNSWDEIQAILDENQFINNPVYDFEFHWSTATNPESRHPRFKLGYEGSPAGFMSNYLMWLMHTEKGMDDPRIRYYFFRKTTTTPTSTNMIGCINSNPYDHYDTAYYPFCTVEDGYVGRDHGDDSATLNDASVRTVFGLYPVGGKFDDDNGGNVNILSGAAGAGISPILTASTVKFWLAEAYLTLQNDPATAKSYLTDAIQTSINDVMDTFDSSLIDPAFEPNATDIANYISYVENEYDAAGTEGKLDIIMKEALISLFGNGIEAYNNYRRTGMPMHIQPSVSPNPGSFFHLFWYPTNHTSYNSNAQQRDISEKVFWAAGTTYNLDF